MVEFHMSTSQSNADRIDHSLNIPTETKTKHDEIGATEIPKEITMALAAHANDGMSSESEEEKRKPAAAEIKTKTGPRQSSKKLSKESSSESSSENDDDDDDDDDDDA